MYLGLAIALATWYNNFANVLMCITNKCIVIHV